MTGKRLSLEEAKQMSQEEKERLIKSIEQQAHHDEVTYWGCSQAVLGALQQHLELGDGETFKAATAFAGGIARTREACGALTGGVMAIGLAYGRAKYEAGKMGMEQVELIECTLRASRFCDRFKERFGGLRCTEVQVSIGFTTEAGLVEFTPKIFKEHAKCGNVTGPAARLAAEVILEPRELFSAEIKAMLDGMARLRKQLAEEEPEGN